MSEHQRQPPAQTQAPSQAAAPEATSQGASAAAPSNTQRANARGLGTLPYPCPGGSTKVQGVDGFDAEALADEIVRTTRASVQDPEADASVLRADALEVVLDVARGRSGRVEQVVMGGRQVSLTITTELRNVRRLESGVGPVAAGDSGDATMTGTGTVTAKAGGDAGGVEASYSEARTEGQGQQRSLGLDALQELFRGDIVVSWDIYHVHCPSAEVGASPLLSLVAANIQAMRAPPVFDSGTRSSGTLTGLRLVDE